MLGLRKKLSSKDKTPTKERKKRKPDGNANEGKPLQMGAAENVTLYLREGLHEKGYEEAVRSGLTRPDKEKLEALLSHAMQMARDHAASPFDPVNNPSDRLDQDHHEKTLAGITDFESRITATEEEIRKRRDSLAGSGGLPPKPHTPYFFLLLSSLLVAATLATTFHDLVFGGRLQGSLAWFISLLPGLLFGGVIAAALLCTYKDEE